MQEAGELSRQAAVQVVDERLEHLGLDVYGLEVIVGHSGRYETAVTVGQCDDIARGTDRDLTVALQAHTDDKTVVLQQIAVEGGGQFGDTRGEIGRVDDEVGRIEAVAIGGAIVVFHMVVESLGRQLRMQFSRTTIHAGTVVVVDAVGDVGRLLHLGQQDAGTNGMDTSGGQVEHIAGRDLMTGQDTGDGIVADMLPIFVGRYLAAETGIEIASRFGVDDVPHLALAHLAVDALSHSIVRMNLDAEVAMGIDELDEQWQLPLVLAVDGTAEDVGGRFPDDRHQVATG